MRKCLPTGRTRGNHEFPRNVQEPDGPGERQKTGDGTVKKILVIGSTVVDVIINLDHLPRTAEDVNVSGQQMAMGGCA